MINHTISPNWNGFNIFTTKLKRIQDNIKSKKCNKNKSPCKYCGHVFTSSCNYSINNVISWDNTLLHYIKKHSIKPNKNFIDRIYGYRIPYDNMDIVKKIKSSTYIMNNLRFVKITKNQLAIMDALMEHGGYVKKYTTDVNKYKYSEHSGTLDFTRKGLSKIIINCEESRLESQDSDVLQPNVDIDMSEYEYIFHTHPPTPFPGARAKEGILYEFPSISDIIHFKYNYNKNLLQGSIVITPEGLYNIRKKELDNKKIYFDDDKFIRKFNKICGDIDDKTINKYGKHIDIDYFYSTIAQDKSFIYEFNEYLSEYSIYIDYFSRVKIANNKWILDDVYIPVYAIEKK
jgi:hypothetical protein